MEGMEDTEKFTTTKEDHDLANKTPFQAVQILADIFLSQSEKYSKRPTKAESARMRKTLNEIKKLVTGAKRELIEKDKA